MKKLKSVLAIALFGTAAVLEPSVAVAQIPVGMTLVWSDEFDGDELDRTKWVTDYYSQMQYAKKSRYDDLMSGKLPQPVYRMTGSSIVLVAGDDTPAEPFEGSRKVSSIQTYDWRTDKLLFDNSLGGYLEARIKRSAAPDATRLNGAFWIDSPGPDSRYFVEKGNTALGVQGVRPRGQVFEIDLCEMMNIEFVLHGDVSPEGEFQHNLEHYPLPDDFRDKWVVHGMLWTPAGLKFYVDGKLRAQSWDPGMIRSPNHAMNIFLGMYGAGGEATMEVDYIRFYQWDLDGDNELPDGGFEYDGTLFPWEGTGSITSSAAKTGKRGVQLDPGEQIAQYVYLDNSCDYEMTFWSEGNREIDATVENITPVVGTPENRFGGAFKTKTGFAQNKVRFSTDPEFENDKRTVRITFKNTGSETVSLDDISVRKRN